MAAFPQIDINCDLGESSDSQHDALLMPWITSCNVACGGHTGNAQTMRATMQLAMEHGVAIGAHPSYPDREGFGRRVMELPAEELEAALQVQVAAAATIIRQLGGHLSHVKPHGALYNVAAVSADTSQLVIEAVMQSTDRTPLMGLAGSVTQDVAAQLNYPFIPEAFADRRYTADGTLASRATVGAVIESPQDAAEQVLQIVQHHRVEALSSAWVTVRARSICVHGDNPKSLDVLKAIDSALKAAGIEKHAFAD